jgi:GTP-binding protein
LPELVAVSKSDLSFGEDVAAIKRGLGTDLAVSSATGAGLDELRRRIFAAVPPVGDGRVAADEFAEGEVEFEAEHMVYRPAGDQGYDVVREDEAFRIAGPGVEMLVARHDLSNLEALAYLEQRLREIGVISALERAGFTPGDEVRIGDEAFELEP